MKNSGYFCSITLNVRKSRLVISDVEPMLLWFVAYQSVAIRCYDVKTAYK